METLYDWMRRARDADHEGVASTVGEHLDRAVDLAEGCSDWRAILSGVVDLSSVPDERVAAIADQTLAAAIEARAVWGFRDVASARVGRLGDEAGARAALQACEDLFGELAADAFGAPIAARGYAWVLLAKGYLTLFDDEEGMRRCLAAGLDLARAHGDADDLCALATEWATVDREAGVALLRETEREAVGSSRPWTIANAWRALDEPGEVRRVLTDALGAAAEVGDALHVARAWASHEEGDEARAALAVAGTLASTASDWLAIAVAAHDGSLGEAQVRLAVARAEAAARSDDERAAVARAYALWLGDDEAANRLGPRGVRPDALRAPVRTLDDWEGSASQLFDFLRREVTAATLQTIAMADYGMDAAKHLAALRDICTTGLVPWELPWEPHEVLALTRWTEGQNTDHLARALACTLLCLSPNDMDELIVNGVVLLDSCLALGPEACDGAERLFVWLAETSQDEDIDPDHAIALFLLLVSALLRASTDSRVESLAEAVLVHPRYGPAAVAEEIADSMRGRLWRELLQRALGQAGEASAAARALRGALGMPG